MPVSECLGADVHERINIPSPKRVSAYTSLSPAPRPGLYFRPPCSPHISGPLRVVGTWVLRSRRGASHPGDLAQRPAPWVFFGEVSARGRKRRLWAQPRGLSGGLRAALAGLVARKGGGQHRREQESPPPSGAVSTPDTRGQCSAANAAESPCASGASTVTDTPPVSQIRREVAPRALLTPTARVPWNTPKGRLFSPSACRVQWGRPEGLCSVDSCHLAGFPPLTWP